MSFGSLFFLLWCSLVSLTLLPHHAAGADCEPLAGKKLTSIPPVCRFLGSKRGGYVTTKTETLRSELPELLKKVNRITSECQKAIRKFLCTEAYPRCVKSDSDPFPPCYSRKEKILQKCSTKEVKDFESIVQGKSSYAAIDASQTHHCSGGTQYALLVVGTGASKDDESKTAPKLGDLFFHSGGLYWFRKLTDPHGLGWTKRNIVLGLPLEFMEDQTKRNYFEGTLQKKIEEKDDPELLGKDQDLWRDGEGIMVPDPKDGKMVPDPSFVLHGHQINLHNIESLLRGEKVGNVQLPITGDDRLLLFITTHGFGANPWSSLHELVVKDEDNRSGFTTGLTSGLDKISRVTVSHMRGPLYKYATTHLVFDPYSQNGDVITRRDFKNKILDNIRAKETLFYLDACFARNFFIRSRKVEGYKTSSDLTESMAEKHVTAIPASWSTETAQSNYFSIVVFEELKKFGFHSGGHDRTVKEHVDYVKPNTLRLHKPTTTEIDNWHITVEKERTQAKSLFDDLKKLFEEKGLYQSTDIEGDIANIAPQLFYRHEEEQSLLRAFKCFTIARNTKDPEYCGGATARMGIVWGGGFNTFYDLFSKLYTAEYDVAKAIKAGKQQGDIDILETKRTNANDALNKFKSQNSFDDVNNWLGLGFLFSDDYQGDATTLFSKLAVLQSNNKLEQFMKAAEKGMAKYILEIADSKPDSLKTIDEAKENENTGKSVKKTWTKSQKKDVEEVAKKARGIERDINQERLRRGPDVLGYDPSNLKLVDFFQFGSSHLLQHQKSTTSLSISESSSSLSSSRPSPPIPRPLSLSRSSSSSSVDEDKRTKRHSSRSSKSGGDVQLTKSPSSSSLKFRARRQSTPHF